MRFSVALFTALSITMVIPKPAVAESDQHRFYVNTGISWINSDTKSEQATMSSIEYNYSFNPTLGADIGYLDVNSDETYNSRYSTLMPNVTYKALFGGAKVQQSIFDVAVLYAKGGISLTSYQENLSLKHSDDSMNSYLMSPYFSIGANIPSLFEPKLDLNLELSYQDLQLNYSNTILMLGAQYRF